MKYKTVWCNFYSFTVEFLVHRSWRRHGGTIADAADPGWSECKQMLRWDKRVSELRYYRMTSGINKYMMSFGNGLLYEFFNLCMAKHISSIYIIIQINNMLRFFQTQPRSALWISHALWHNLIPLDQLFLFTKLK